MTLTFDFSKSNFKKAVSQELIDVKQKESKSIRYWADCMFFPFDHTHDLVVSKSKFEIALFEEWRGDAD